MQTQSKRYEVAFTNNLDQFVQLDGNRDINKNHAKRLSESMDENGMLVNPIIVNEKNEVIDGQHRLEAAKITGSGVYFLIVPGYKLNEVHALNANQSEWSSKQYMDSYADLGVQDYILLRDFVNRYGYGVSLSLRICSDDGHRGQKGLKEFKHGKWKISNYEESCDFADKMQLIAPFYDGYKRSAFTRAMFSLMKKDVFDFYHFIDKLKLQPRALVDLPNSSQYIELIEEIYNYKKRNKVNLRY